MRTSSEMSYLCPFKARCSLVISITCSLTPSFPLYFIVANFTKSVLTSVFLLFVNFSSRALRYLIAPVSVSGMMPRKVSWIVCFITIMHMRSECSHLAMSALSWGVSSPSLLGLGRSNLNAVSNCMIPKTNFSFSSHCLKLFPMRGLI